MVTKHEHSRPGVDHHDLSGVDHGWWSIIYHLPGDYHLPGVDGEWTPLSTVHWTRNDAHDASCEALRDHEASSGRKLDQQTGLQHDSTNKHNGDGPAQWQWLCSQGDGLFPSITSTKNWLMECEHPGVDFFFGPQPYDQLFVDSHQESDKQIWILIRCFSEISGVVWHGWCKGWESPEWWTCYVWATRLEAVEKVMTSMSVPLEYVWTSHSLISW